MYANALYTEQKETNRKRTKHFKSTTPISMNMNLIFSREVSNIHPSLKQKINP